MGSEVGEIIYEEKLCIQEQLEKPTWSNGLKKIYSNCPEVFVGIATTQPKFNLDVRGTSYTTKLAIGTLTNDLVPTPFYLQTGLGQSVSSEIFLLENNGRKIFQINNNGTVKARDIIVNTQIWADYVFKPSYKLWTLSETEDFIQKNGHLPDVPSEETVTTKGINVAEMQVIQMQKIEELTLHMIEQDKLLKAQQKLIEKQAEQLKKLELLLQK